MKRESGYYWVKLDGEWEVAFFDAELDSGSWLRYEREDEKYLYGDNEFEEIDERKIEREDLEVLLENTLKEIDANPAHEQSKKTALNDLIIYGETRVLDNLELEDVLKFLKSQPLIIENELVPEGELFGSLERINRPGSAVPEDALEGNFHGGKYVHDWQAYVPEEWGKLWPRLTKRERKIIAVVGQMAADSEIWE